MTDEIPASSQIRPEDEAQGQKMTIYMPQGAVIIEKSEQEGRAETATQIPLEEKPTTPKAGVDSVQSLGSVINIYTGDEYGGVKEQSHSKVLPADSALMSEQQVLLRISEMLDVITKRLDHEVEPVELVREVQQTNSVNTLTQSVEEIEEKSADSSDVHEIQKTHVSTGHVFDWMHAFNLMFISIILFTLLLPAALHTFFGTEVIPALTSYEVAGIQKGDLLITEETQASNLVVGDVLSLHDAFSGTSEVIQVSEISAPGENGVMTLAIPPRAGQTLSLSYSLNGDSEVYKVVKSVPTLGAAKTLLDSFFVQFFTVAFVILLNIIVHFRRHRRYTKALRAYANQ
ncbi:MAG: hypothetical protein Q7R42_00395 [Candidatus Planktophila sp.]|nr:hypothetical protein [Candidatus Planktophila sp.]